jgi:starch synthase
MDSKIVYSLYGNEFSKDFSENFTQKVMIKGMEKEELGTITEPINFIQLSKLAIDHADAVVQQTPDVDSELIAYAKQSGKPFLPYQEENMMQAISDFYDII